MTQAEINSFLDKVALKLHDILPNQEPPSIETTRQVIEHYNRGRMKGFETAGYFVFNGVKVYEEGKMPKEVEA